MKTILLIENNLNILENLAEYFEMEGYKILTAYNGRKGVDKAIEFMPDLIICDVLMPEMNGYEVLCSLIENDKTYKIPFIFSTCVSETTDRAGALNLGADEYIIKPFEPEILLQMAKRLIESGSKRQLSRPSLR